MTEPGYRSQRYFGPYRGGLRLPAHAGWSQPHPLSPKGGLGAVVDTDRPVDAGQVPFDGAFGDPEATADLLVGQPHADEPEHFLFTIGEDRQRV